MTPDELVIGTFLSSYLETASTVVLSVYMKVKVISVKKVSNGFTLLPCNV
jgi:hypothetical protein